MSLLVYNKTAALLTLPVGTSPVTLQTSSVNGVRGPAGNATAELKSLSNADYSLLQDMQPTYVNGAVLLGNLTNADTDVPLIPPTVTTSPVNNTSFMSQSGYFKIDSEYLHWSSAFYAQATLTVALGPADVAATLGAAVSAFPATGFAWVQTTGGNELISWTSKSGTQLLGLSRNLRGTSNGGATAAIGTFVIANFFSGVTRGQLGSSAASHTNGAVPTIAPLIDAEWTNVEEYRTGLWLVDNAENSSTNTDVQLFADAALGSDFNIGQAPGVNAVQSLKRLCNLIPGGWRSSGICFLSGATYSYPEFGLFTAGAGSRGINPDRGAPIAFVGADPTLLAGPFTVGSINADSSVEVGGAFTADQYFGGLAAGVKATIRVLSGPLKGQTRMCAGNTTTALLPATPLTGIQVGNTIQLETTSTTIQIPSGVSWTNVFGDLGLKGIRIQHLAGSAGFVVADAAFVVVENVTMDMTAGGSMTVSRSGVLFANNTLAWAGMRTNNPFSSLRADGMFVDARTGASTNFSVLQGGTVLGNNYLFRKADVFVSQKALVTYSGHARDSSVTTRILSYNTASGPSAAARSLWMGKYASRPYGMNCTDLSKVSLDNIMILGAATAIQAGNFVAGNNSQGGYVELGTVSGNTTTDVTAAAAYVPTIVANSGIGVQYAAGSRVMFNKNSGTTSVAGTAADTQGQNPATDINTWATLNTPDGAGFKGYTDSYLNRIEAQT